MSSSTLNKNIAGVVILVDEENHVLGIATDGDIRRGLEKGITVDQSISAIANFSQFLVNADLNPQQMRQHIKGAKERKVDYRKYQQIILVDEDGKFKDLVLLTDIFNYQIEDRIVAVYGLGFVGLTLASVLANAGLLVVGVDTNDNVIHRLRQGQATFFENGLQSLLEVIAKSNPIVFTSNSDSVEADIHIVCVGTPVDHTNTPDYKYIIEASESISSRLKKAT